MKKAILIMATNGVGLGHLTRALAVAQELRHQEPKYEIIIFTTSLATEVIREMGFMYYYIPTIELMPKGIAIDYWHHMLSEQLSHLIRIYEPVVFLYDGACPYLSIISQTIGLKSMVSIWIKREGDREGFEFLEEYEKLFHCVIIPKELGIQYPEKREKNRVYVSPILLADKKKSYEREKVRDVYQIKEDEELVYIQLGAGTINDIQSPIDFLVKELLNDTRTHIILGESLIGRHLNISSDRVATIRSYPNYYYYYAFDAAISAAGYNTVYELFHYGIPTLYIPNECTEKDDQVARARRIEKMGCAVCAQTRKEIIEKWDILHNNKNKYQEQMRNKAFLNGVMEAVEIVRKYI